MPIDYSKYPPNWKSEIRPRILKRANDCCENCGIKNYTEGIRSKKELVEDIDVYITDCATMPEQMLIDKWSKDWDKLKWIKIILTIVHLDHDPENWEVKDDRLKALCQKCHLSYDRKHKKKMSYKNSLFPL